MKSRLAIIMSVYVSDTLEFVSQAVNSILSQTISDFDFFVQFDGVVRPEVDQFFFELQDKRVRIFKREINKGLAYSLNELLSVVLPRNYSYIARMDADDISLPVRFEKQIAYLENHKEVDCVGSWAIEILSDGSEYYRKQMPISHDECRELFKKRDCMIHPTVMFRPSYFEKAGLYSLDTYFGEDTMLWANGFASGCVFANVPDYLFKFRLDTNFFNRRRGWKHAHSIFTLRHRVNDLLGFGLMADIWALLYALAKLMPTKILNVLYKTLRK